MAARQMLHGFHAVTARLKRAPDTIRELYVAEKRNDARARSFLQLAKAQGVRVIPVSPERLQGLAGKAPHQGVVAVVDALVMPQDIDEVLDALNEPPLLLVLDGVTDPHNLGACLRVADAFGAHAIIAPKDHSAPLTDVAAKAASGAAETVPYVLVTNLARSLRELQDRNVWLIGTDADAEDSLWDIKVDAGMAWVLGAEGSGMRRLTREHCDELVRIPMFGTVESLNVSVSAGVCLAESRRQRVAAG